MLAPSARVLKLPPGAAQAPSGSTVLGVRADPIVRSAYQDLLACEFCLYCSVNSSRHRNYLPTLRPGVTLSGDVGMVIMFPMSPIFSV